MSPKKLNEDDKTEILKRYRESSATTSTLADQFGVSSSTISRFLKNSLSETEYDVLIQQKRLARTTKEEEESEYSPKQTYLELYLNQTAPNPSPVVEQPLSTLELEEVEKEEENGVETEEIAEESPSGFQRPIKMSQKAPEKELNPDLPQKNAPRSNRSLLEGEEATEDDSVQMAALGEMFGEDLLDIDEEDDLEEDWDEEEDDTEDYAPSVTSETSLQILPLASAKFPPTCYIVIDRTSELITCPLREFTHLGNIPDNEVYQRTLPVFDNHRVARRFSKRSQRVIKVPDSRLFHKTSSYLEAKGITRIFLDGHIYALSPV